jgi:hypothetical protein
MARENFTGISVVFETLRNIGGDVLSVFLPGIRIDDEQGPYRHEVKIENK